MPSSSLNRAEPAQDAPATTGGDTAMDLLRLDRQLCFALYSASLAMTKVYKPMLAPLGLTYPQYLVMLLLWEHDDRTVNELGHLLHLDSGTLTPLLKRLETHELLSRQRDTQDERRVRVRLTPKGRELREQASQIPVELACKVELSSDAITALRKELGQLRERLAAAAPPEAEDGLPP